MASQVHEAEKPERLFNGKGRWHYVKSLPAEAKSIMNYLFQLASSARYAIIWVFDAFYGGFYVCTFMVCGFLFLYFACRCQVLDKEVMCDEKEHTISELKEKVVVLNSGIRQLETQAIDLISKHMKVKFDDTRFHDTKV